MFNYCNMKGGIIIVFLIAQINAMSWPEFSGDSFGSLVSDVVTDIGDNIDCTILAVERVLSLDGLFQTSPEYEAKCGGRSAYTETSDTSWFDNLHTQPELTETKKQLSAEIEVSVSSASEHIQSVIDHSTAKQKIQKVKDSLKNESDRVSRISALLKKEVDKIPAEVKKKFKFDSNHINGDGVVEEVKLLYETEQSDKGSAVAKGVRRVFYEVLNILNVTDIDTPLSDDEQVKLILTNIYQHSNNSLFDVEKQVSMWTKEVMQQITNTTNVVIDLNSSCSDNKTNEKFNQIDVINNKLYDEDNYKNKTTTTQVVAIKGIVATNSGTDDTAEKRKPKSKSIQITNQSNATCISHTVTSIITHKTNETSVEVVHNETRIPSTHLPKSEYDVLMPPTNVVNMSQHNNIADPIISKLLSNAQDAASNKSNLSVLQSSMGTEKRLPSSHHTAAISTHQLSVTSNSSAVVGTLSVDPPNNVTSPSPLPAAHITETETDSLKPKFSAAMPLHKTDTQTNDTSSSLLTGQGIGSSSQQPQLRLQKNDTHPIATSDSVTPSTTQTANISTTEQPHDQANVMTSPSSSQVAETDASKSDSPNTQLHTINKPDHQDTSRERTPQKHASQPAAPSQTVTSTKPPKPKQYPKNFRDLSQHILRSPKSDEFNDYDSSVPGKFDLGVLEQLFGDKVEQQEAVQDAKSIIESSQKSQNFINKIFRETKSAPSVFDDPEYSDY